MRAKLKLAISYKYAEEPMLKLLCARMLEDAFRRRPDVEVYHVGETSDLDVLLGMEPEGEGMSAPPPIVAWWDTEACSDLSRGWHHSAQLVLAPYTCGGGIDRHYPKGKTYLFPFATDPRLWHYWPCEPEREVGFIGREDNNRARRVEALTYLEENGVNLMRGNGVERGPTVSKLLSKCQIILQCSGDAGGGVMETRFFECGLIAPMVVDITDANRDDFYWAGVPGHHYITYETNLAADPSASGTTYCWEELLEKITAALADEEYLPRMRQRAVVNHMRRHTYDVRAREFLEQIGFLKGPGLPDFHAKRTKATA